MLLKDRSAAGILLAEQLTAYCQKPVCILGLARGGVVTAASTAQTLHLPFDVLVVKKLSSPYNKEFAVGAIAPDGVSVVHWRDAQRAGCDEISIRHITDVLSDQVKHDMAFFRKGRKPIDVAGKTVILIDDGTATGASMEVAILWSRKKRARRIIVALPVAPKEVMDRLKPDVDTVIVYMPVDRFETVGSYYQHFTQVPDSEVVQLIEGRTI